MRYSLKHLKSNGRLESSSGDIGYLAFCKHLAFAGFGVHKSPMLAYRYLGYFFEFRQYWRHNPNHFSIIPPFNNDPTEKAYISKKIGCAFADYFAKRLYKARYTHAYEDVMIRQGFPIQNERPDYYCDNLKQQFAIESKGFSRKSVSTNDMNEHKQQSQSGPVPVNFSIASVSYDLYSKPKIKYYDPINENVEYNEDVNQQLRSLYYDAVIELIEFFGSERSTSDFSDYYTYDLFPFIEQNFRLIIHRAIVTREWSENEWLPNPNESDRDLEDGYAPYIDLDGIGLLMR